MCPQQYPQHVDYILEETEGKSRKRCVRKMAWRAMFLERCRNWGKIIPSALRPRGICRSHTLAWRSIVWWWNPSCFPELTVWRTAIPAHREGQGSSSSRLTEHAWSARSDEKPSPWLLIVIFSANFHHVCRCRFPRIY